MPLSPEEALKVWEFPLVWVNSSNVQCTCRHPDMLTPGETQHSLPGRKTHRLPRLFMHRHATASHVWGHDGRKEKGTAWHLELTAQWQSRCLCVAAKRLPAATWLFFCSWCGYVRNWGKVQQMASTLLLRKYSSEQREDILKTQSCNRFKTQSQF